MATTTNYSWTTPDDTALVKDGAAAIRSLGTAIDTTTKALNPSTTLGDIEFRSSTANTNTRLGIGSTGNVLTVAGGVPTWAAPGGGGKVLQVVAANTTTPANNSTANTFADTGLTATITPSSASSKILILISQSITKAASNVDLGLTMGLFRGVTQIGNDQKALYTNSLLLLNEYMSFSFLDSPNTTSSTTYKTQFKPNVAHQLSCQNDNSQSSIVLLEIGA
jgi:hypothetical protein